jgi:pimeloyl-ACP methyl ester carboxylesterase
VYSNRVSGVALLAPYKCLADVGQAHIKIFPVRWILTEHFPAEENLRNYHGPVAILLAGRDKVVPAGLGRRLYESYGGRKKLWEFPEADHETLMDQTPEVWKEVVNFWGAGEPETAN